MRTPSVKVVNPSRRILRRKAKELRRRLRVQELTLNYILGGRDYYVWRGLPRVFRGRRRMSPLSRLTELHRHEASLMDNRERLQVVKREAADMLPTKQTSRPRVKHDRRR